MAAPRSGRPAVRIDSPRLCARHRPSLWAVSGPAHTLIAVVHLISTIVVRRLEITVTQELARYVLVEYLLMVVVALVALVALVAPSGSLGIAIVAIGSLGSNSPYLPQNWFWGLAAIATLTLVAPAVIYGLSAGPVVIGAGSAAAR